LKEAFIVNADNVTFGIAVPGDGFSDYALYLRYVAPGHGSHGRGTAICVLVGNRMQHRRDQARRFTSQGSTAPAQMLKDGALDLRFRLLTTA
jgi:hypothetical protein